MISDHHQRERALDTSHSFIVQAPAGSGKTELLIQRYLALLANVDSGPESIVAITFTRKASHEMRARVLEALHFAETSPEPESGHRKKTWELANAVLKRSAEKNWELLKNPNRLSIQTFDSFCSRLARQLPLLSGFGGLPQLLEDPQWYYEQAAEQVWLDYSDNKEWSSPIKNLLWHVDSQLPRLQRLLADLLSCREQWLDYVGSAHNTEELSAILQKHLSHLIEDVLKKAHDRFSPELESQLLGFISFAHSNISTTGYYIPLITSLPSYETTDLKYWKAIAQFLLTNESEVRKTIDKRLGFPAKSEGKTPEEKAEFQQQKDHMKTFLSELSLYPQFIEALRDVQQLPDAEYAAKQQQVVIDLLKVLTLAVAELMILFQQHGACDFNQLLLGALQALGTPEQPTDLAMALDYRIQHVLVDEFQDTSVAQFRLLERLTMGWSPNDGRTLFLVGDPMQSIYRFRQAEVGLFLAAWERGIGQIPLQTLVLEVNFRSVKPIVDWINHQMSAAFPSFSDIGVGAVPFTPAIAFDQSKAGHVSVNIQFNKTAEAKQVLALVQSALADPSQEKIAILVRTRNQLLDILPLLQEANIPYEAVDIESLSSRAVLQDLLVLTRALLHPADRLAWLALLRAPWCGLTLADLTHMVGEQPGASILDRLNNITDWSVFSLETQTILPSVINLLQDRLAQRQRLPVSRWVLSTWLALGGPDCYKDPTVISDAELFFHLLEKLEPEIYQLSPAELEDQLARLYATPKHKQSRLQVMTMHKAKGLEFDTVIVPGLHANSRSDNKTLLTWWERPRENGGAEVLIAPLHAVGDKEDLLYRYLWAQQQRAAELESTRLLYVAFTRAKSHLHLLGVLEMDLETGVLPEPTSNSLLAKIWKTVRETAALPEVNAAVSEI